MKTAIFTYFLISITLWPAFAQTDLSIVFNSVHIGRNLSFSGSKKFNRHTILGGIKYGINSIEQSSQNEVFKKRFFATTFMEHWGLIARYQYAIKYNKPYLEPYFFYEFQFTNSQTRNRSFLPVGYDVEGNVLYREFIDYFGPTIALENYLGVGLNVQLSKHIFMTQKAGVGFINYQNVDARHLSIPSSTWEFGYMLSFGIMYRLKEKKDE